MIIKKQRFNLTPGYKGKWPFTVPEVTVKLWLSGKTHCMELIHNFGGFALHGELENNGFDNLEKSRIWAKNPDYPDQKKSLSLFLKYVQAIAEREIKKNG